MKEIAISKFKATCLGVLEDVRKTRRPVLVTRFGKPIAEIVPPSPRPGTKRVLGAREGKGEILRDIVRANPWLDAEKADRKAKR